MNWISVKDEVPPFDTRVLVRGKHKEYGFYLYAIAYNEVYRPDMNLTQVVEVPKEYINKFPCYLPMPFEVEEWIELE